jgi:hippurate hydrolase
VDSEKVLEPRIIDFRRSLHGIPELDFDLPKTRGYLLSVLEPLGFDIHDLGPAGFSVFIDNGKDDTIAFRSDMDALPICEPEGCAFGSEHVGMMHACGHDGHMAMLLGLAVKCSEWFASKPDAQPLGPTKNCLLIFQAAEETNGGAKIICDTGALKDYGVSSIFGLHLWPKLHENTVSCRPGGFMAGTSVLEISIEGKSAHIADYKKGIDALEAGCTFVERAYELERELPPEIFRVLRFGKFVSGTANNIVSGNTEILGTIRFYDEKTLMHIIAGLEKIMRGVEAEKGVRFSFSYTDGYPPVINPPDLYERAKATLTKAGFAWHEPDAPYMYAEDFAFYQRVIPGLYMHLGMGNRTRMHSPEFEMNESVLITGIRLMWTLLTESNPG